MRFKNPLLILILIVFFGSFLRMWMGNKYPPGFYSDEALYGYEAYSLLKTGKDQFGHLHPTSIAGFGDYRPALYIYATIPFIKFLGLTEFTTRLPSIIFSILTLFVSYFFINALTKKPKLALFSVLFMSLSPWSIYFGRMAHETNLMTLLVTVGIWFLWRSRKCLPCLIMSLLAFSASTYTYHSARVFVPLFFTITALLFHQHLFKHRTFKLLAGLIFLLTLAPLIIEFQSGGGWARVKGISFWTDPGVISQINEERRVAQIQGLNPLLIKLIHNKMIVYPQIFLKNYFSHFSIEFLLTKGDPNGVYNTPNTGILLWIEPLLILIGIVYLWKYDKRLAIWIGSILLITLVPDSLTRLSPSSARIHLALPFVALLSGAGAYVLTKKFRSTTFILGLLLIINSYWFWHNYIYVLPVVNARAWQIGTKAMVLKAQSLHSQYDKIWISRTGWGWIQILFYTKHDPLLWQKEVKISEQNDLGFWWVSDVEKYHLEWLPAKLVPGKILYIATPAEFSSDVKPFTIIKDDAGNEKFWFVDGENINGKSL